MWLVSSTDLLVPASDPIADFHGEQEGKGHAEKDGERQKRSGVGAEKSYGDHELKV